eukprot:m.152451 g.152451  ORF g.152451 m.152451 type:complete len:151 (+) comp38589_c0_seq13:170-622(+)
MKCFITCVLAVLSCAYFTEWGSALPVSAQNPQESVTQALQKELSLALEAYLASVAKNKVHAEEPSVRSLLSQLKSCNFIQIGKTEPFKFHLQKKSSTDLAHINVTDAGEMQSPMTPPLINLTDINARIKYIPGDYNISSNVRNLKVQNEY